jgi:hypothetical protein
MTLTELLAFGGFVLGLAGTVLGIFNTWRIFDRDRVKVRVVPVTILLADGSQRIGIDVTNLGFVAVTINGVGFALAGKNDNPRLVWFMPDVLFSGKHCKLPQRMEPRTCLTVIGDPGAEDHEAFAHVVSAFAQTACGRYYFGTNDLIAHLKHKARAAGS